MTSRPRGAPDGGSTVLEMADSVAAMLEQAGVSFGHGCADAFDEAAWLVLAALRLPPDGFEHQAGRTLTAAEQRAVRDLARLRVATRRPLAYLVGEAWLQGLQFHADERAIVPRSLIAEVLADGSADPWLPQAPRRVLDLCTGGGSLAVIAALTWPDARVDATDVSAAALELARLNLRRHGVESRVDLRQGDGLAAARGRYDLVLCNPPYVTRRSMAELPPEYRAEPALALDGGDDGMDFVRPLLRGVAAHLGDDGVLLLEVGHERAAFEAAFPGLHPVWLATSSIDDGVLLLERKGLA